MSVYESAQLPTYRAATTATVTIATNNEAFFVIEGSASKEVIVEKIAFSGGTLTAVAYNSLVIEKFSTAFAGGTATTLTKVPLDSKFPTSTATTCQVYTAVPTEGTLVGTIACRRVLLENNTAAAGATTAIVEFDFTDLDGGGVVLRGITEGLGLAFSTDPGSAVLAGVEVQWKERGGQTFTN